MWWLLEKHLMAKAKAKEAVGKMKMLLLLLHGGFNSLPVS